MSFFRKLHLIAMSALMIYSLSLCAQTEERNVDLSTVRLDGISIGDNIDAVMDSNYTKTNRFPINAGNETISYEEWRITISDDVIIKIDANVYDGVHLSIGDMDCKKVDEVIDILGDRYRKGWYDREQQLEELVYLDQDHKVQVSFIYSCSSEQLVYVVIRDEQNKS